MANKRKDHNGFHSVSASTSLFSNASEIDEPVTLSPNKLKRLFANMLLCRMMEEKVLRASREYRIACNGFQIRGQEAIEAGATLDLRSEDRIAACRRRVFFEFVLESTNPESGNHKAVNGELTGAFAGIARSFRGLSAATRRNNGVAFAHDVGGTGNLLALEVNDAMLLSLATGAALHCEKPGIMLAFATINPGHAGFPHEAIRFASRHKLPVVYIVQDHGTGQKRSPNQKTDARTKLQDQTPEIMIDGNDAVAVCRVAQEAIRRAREGHGPALIHCTHYGTRKDPLETMQIYLEQKGIWSSAWKQELCNNFANDLTQAVVTAKRFHAKERKP